MELEDTWKFIKISIKIIMKLIDVLMKKKLVNKDNCRSSVRH